MVFLSSLPLSFVTFLLLIQTIAASAWSAQERQPFTVPTVLATTVGKINNFENKANMAFVLKASHVAYFEFTYCTL